MRAAATGRATAGLPDSPAWRRRAAGNRYRCRRAAERGTGGADANVVFLEAESAKRLCREMASEVIVRAGFLEHRGLDAGHRNLQLQRRVARDDGLARRESRHVVAEARIFRSAVRRHEEIAGRDIEVRRTDRFAIRHERQQVAGVALYDRALGGGAGRED